MGSKFASEYKLDGERVQIHIEGEKVILFSRSLENISSYYPDIIEKIPKSIQADNAILEAEAVAAIVEHMIACFLFRPLPLNNVRFLILYDSPHHARYAYQGSGYKYYYHTHAHKFHETVAGS